jgi:hypothetical protein
MSSTGAGEIQKALICPSFCDVFVEFREETGIEDLVEQSCRSHRCAHKVMMAAWVEIPMVSRKV